MQNPDLIPDVTAVAATGSQRPPIERLVFTADEVCAAIGICRVSLWRLGKRNLLRPIPHLRHKLYSVAAVKRFVDSGN